MLAVVPLYPDLDGASRPPQLLGRQRAMTEMMAAGRAGWRSTASRTTQGTPVYVHAKACVVDDIWASIGSDNFNRRSWTHDSELSAVVVDRSTYGDDEGEHGAYARRLRLALAAEHLDRPFDPEVDASDEASLLRVMADCVDPLGMFEAYAAAARALEAWHRGGRRGPRPPGGSVRSSPRGSARSPRRWPCRRTSCCTTRTAGPGRCASRTASEPAG